MGLPTMEALFGGQDKVGHHVAGNIAAGIGALVLPPLGAAFGLPIRRSQAALAAAALVGALKEGADAWANRKARAAGLPPPHGVDPYDFLATVSGALPMAAAFIAAGD